VRRIGRSWHLKNNTLSRSFNGDGVNETDTTLDTLGDFRDGVERSEVLARIDQALEDPVAADDFVRILETALGGRPDERTWGELYELFSMYVGVARDPRSVELPDLLWRWASASSRERQDLEAIVNPRPRLARLIRRMVARQRASILQAYGVWKEFPHNWQNIGSRILLDPNSGMGFFQIDLTKMNGETVYLEGTGTSVLELTLAFVRVLHKLRDPDTLDRDSVADFRQEVSVLLDRLPDGRDSG
jgi:hypothetical protein